MKTINVESTTLTRVGYDASARLLCVEFRDRTTYQYFGVPAEVHASLISAPSKGQYFNRAIRWPLRLCRCAQGIDSRFFGGVNTLRGLSLILALMWGRPPSRAAGNSGAIRFHAAPLISVG